MTTIGKRRPVRLSALSCKAEKRASNPVTSPPGTEYFDIVSPPPGDREVVSQVERLSSSETKIAPRLVWIAVWSSGRGSAAGTVASRVMGSATSLCLGADRYPPPWYLYRYAQGYGDAGHAGAADARDRSIFWGGFCVSRAPRWLDQGFMARRRGDVPVHQTLGTRAVHLADVVCRNCVAHTGAALHATRRMRVAGDGA